MDNNNKSKNDTSQAGTGKKNNNSNKRRYRRTQGPNNSNNKNNIKNNSINANSDDEDGETCLICADVIKYVSLTPCNHRTCHKCSFRQRALYEKNTCLVCRSENDKLIFTDDLDKNYNDFDLSENSSTKFVFNSKFNIFFTSMELSNLTLNLLKFNCTLCDDENDRLVNYENSKKYNAHLNSVHNKNICLICSFNKHAFCSELPIFTQNQLKNHQSRGNSKNEGFNGHPLCGFCSNKRFYGDDELYIHMREKHEKCHICDKLNPSSPQYFKDYDHLFDHFKAFHYICTVQTCLDSKFVVFGDEIELQAHILEQHGDIIRGKPKLFQSELSTFVSAPSRVINESSNQFNNPLSSSSSRSLSSLNNNNDTSSNTSPEVKKLRLEQRAKHYLHNNEDDYNTFIELNESYAESEITSNELMTSYKSLFKNNNEADIYLLINNLSSTFLPTSTKFKELKAIYDEHEIKEERKQTSLPSLTSSTFNGNVTGGIWSKSSSGKITIGDSGSSRSFSTRSLPSLEKKSKNHNVFAPQIRLPPTKTNTNYRPVRTNLSNNTPSSASYSNISTAPSSVKTIKSTVITNSVQLSTNSLERLGGGNGSAPKSSSNNWGSKKSNSSSNSNKDKLKAMNLPTLAPKPKRIIKPLPQPELPNPKNWGKTDGSVKSTTDELEGLTLSNKKGKKQKQLLFHIGV